MAQQNVSDWSTSPENNTDLAPPATLAVNQLDNAIRSAQAFIRKSFNNLPWFEYGDGDGDQTVSYVSATQFKIGGADVTAIFSVGTRVRATGTLTGDIKGTISATSFSSPDTTVTVDWDSGNLESEALVIFVSLINTDTIPGYAGSDLFLDDDRDTGFDAQIANQIRAFCNNITVARFLENQLRLFSTASGASKNPVFRLMRESTSPADGDELGAVEFYGRNSVASDELAALIKAAWDDVTDGTEDARLILQAVIGGALTNIVQSEGKKLLLGKDTADSGATEGVELDPEGRTYITINGAPIFDLNRLGYTSGEVDLINLSIDDEKIGSISFAGDGIVIRSESGKTLTLGVPDAASLIAKIGGTDSQIMTGGNIASPTTSLSSGAQTYTLAHGLGGTPKFVRAVLVMGSTTELGYSEGEEVELINVATVSDINQHIAVSADDTNVSLITQITPRLPNKGSPGSSNAITPANWTLKIYAMV